MSLDPTSFDRLKRWRDIGDGPTSYTAGSKPFGDDVIVMLAEIERLNELLRGVGANRYWEGCWRDESAENARLRASLLAAADDIEAWGAYACAYFQEKHDLPGDIEKYRAIARAHQQSITEKS